jgi:hypothetical protein
MKEDNYEGEIFTEREKKKPIEKIIKNIELSYYNFEKKDIKRVKEQDKIKQANINKNKKSMPTLPLHQNYQKTPQHPPRPIHQSKFTGNHMIASSQPLKPKDVNKLTIKSKSKDHLKKVSLNSSIDSPKNLSRSKSKSNLVMLHPDHNSKRNSVKPFQEIVILPKNEKAKSNPTSLQKTSSHKNFLKKEDPKKSTKAFEKLDEIKENNGLKNMFKKVMQTKKVIKIAR